MTSQKPIRTVEQAQEQNAKQSADAMQDMPITLNLTLRKVNFLIGALAQLPYEKSYQVIADIQSMVVGQVKSAQEQTQNQTPGQAQTQAQPQAQSPTQPNPE